MGLFDKLRGELIDIIQWLDDSRDTLVYRFERYGNEIKNGAKLVVRETQQAVFVNEGKLADVFKPGTYELLTRNLPILATLQGWKYGFESPFKAEVYFVNTRQFTDLKWGTQNPVIVRDPEFGPVRLRAFGGYAMRVVDAGAFIKELAGTDPLFKTEEVSEYLRQLVVSKVAGVLGESGISVLDIASKQSQMEQLLAQRLTQDLKTNGIEITRFIVENVSLPPEVEQALDKRSQMGVLGDLNRYTQFQAAQAMEQAAKNPGGAGEGIGLGAGLALGQQMARSFAGAGAPPTGPAQPPPLDAPVAWFLGVGGKQLGPFDAAALAAEAAGGRLTPTTLVWRQGLAAWVAAKDVPELARLLSSGPPPLPTA